MLNKNTNHKDPQHWRCWWPDQISACGKGPSRPCRTCSWIYNANVSTKTKSWCVSTHPLSLRIPALLMRIVTVPKASTALLITAAPSVTEVLTTAFPPLKCHQLLTGGKQNILTLLDFIDNLLCSNSIEIVDYDVSYNLKRFDGPKQE